MIVRDDIYLSVYLSSYLAMERYDVYNSQNMYMIRFYMSNQIESKLIISRVRSQKKWVPIGWKLIM